MEDHNLMETLVLIISNLIQALNLKWEKNMSLEWKMKIEMFHLMENHNIKIDIQASMFLESQSIIKIKYILHSINHFRVILHTKPVILKSKSILMTKKHPNNMISPLVTSLMEKQLMVIALQIKSQIQIKATNHINL